MFNMIEKIKVVEYQRPACIYREVGEIEVFRSDNVEGCFDEGVLCIDIDDLLEWVKYRR